MSELNSQEIDKLFKAKIGNFSKRSFEKYCEEKNWKPEQLVHVVWTDERHKNWSMLSRVGYLLSVKNNPNNPAFLKYVIELYQKEKMLDIQTEPGEPDAIWSYWAMLNMVGPNISNRVKDAMKHLSQGSAIPGDGGWISKAIEMRLNMRQDDAKAWRIFEDAQKSDHRFFMGLLTSNKYFSRPFEYGTPSSPLKPKSEAWPALNTPNPVEIAVPEDVDQNFDLIFQQYVDFASQSKSPPTIHELFKDYTWQLTEPATEKVISILQSPVFWEATSEPEEQPSTQNNPMTTRQWLWDVKHLRLLRLLIISGQASKLTPLLEEQLYDKATRVLALEKTLGSSPALYSSAVQQWVEEKNLKQNVKKVLTHGPAAPLNRF